MAIFSDQKPATRLIHPSARPQGQTPQAANDNVGVMLRFLLDDLAARREPRGRAEIDAIRQMLKDAPHSALRRNPEAMRHWRYSFFPLDRHVDYDTKFHEAKAMSPAQRMMEIAKLAQAARAMQGLVEILRADASPAEPERRP